MMRILPPKTEQQSNEWTKIFASKSDLNFRNSFGYKTLDQLRILTNSIQTRHFILLWVIFDWKVDSPRDFTRHFFGFRLV